MAAKTRGEILTLVHEHTGRTKAALEPAFCDDALKVALMKHSFRDAQSEPTDITITEDTTEVTIVTTDVINIITVRIVEADGSRNKILKLKTRNWWDEHVINPEDNMKGWPKYGLHWGSKIVFDRPPESGLKLRLRVTTAQIFTDDNTVCPIYVLDKFVEHYVTAQIFKSVRSWDSYAAWMRSALGPKWETSGDPGGELLAAINADSVLDTALDIRASEPFPTGAGGVAVENVISGHDDLGNTRWWK